MITMDKIKEEGNPHAQGGPPDKDGSMAATRLLGLALFDTATAMESANDAGLEPAWLGGTWQSEGWKAIAEMYSKGLPIDTDFVSEYAKERGLRVSAKQLEEAYRIAPSQRGSSDHLIALLHKEHVDRETKRLAWILGEDGDDPVQRAANVATELLEVAVKHGTENKETARQQILEEWRRAENGVMPGLAMPWSRFAARCGGPEPGQVCIVVGHGAAGKSLLILQWALYLTEKHVPCAIFSLEDGMTISYKRLACMKSGEMPALVRSGIGNMAEVKKALDHVMEMPIHISPVRGSIQDISVAAQRLTARHGIKAIFIDAFKDISRKDWSVQGDNEVMAGLCEMAKRLKVPVIMCHHVRKPPTSLKGSNPWEAFNIDPSDLRGSGRLWDDARMVIALQLRPDGKWKDKFNHELHLLKSNHSMSGGRVSIERGRGLTWVECGEAERGQ